VETKGAEDAWKLVVATINESFTHVARCYELDTAGAFDRPTPESRSFIMGRCVVAAQFTSDLFYAAWLKSAKLPPSF
jgi:hypothetical protein